MDDDDAQEIEALEQSAKNVEDAIEDGLAELGLERHEVNVEVLSEGRAGLFGIGGEPARVRLTPVTLDEPEGDDIAFAQETLETLLELMDIEAETIARAPETAGDGTGLVTAVFDITGDDLGVLIGRRGATMGALQYLLNVMVSRRYRGQGPYGVDVEGYRQRREKTLEEVATRMAQQVRGRKRPVTLEPMPANERRIVHMALAKDPTVMTGSVGEGEHRKVVIGPRD